jgi:hypothetical protein
LQVLQVRLPPLAPAIVMESLIAMAGGYRYAAGKPRDAQHVISLAAPSKA